MDVPEEIPELGDTRVVAGPIEFALRYRRLVTDVDPTTTDQGVCIQVVTEVGGMEVELLRFDCFDRQPHYHYSSKYRIVDNDRIILDKTTAGNPIAWTIHQLRHRLPDMLEKSGCDELAAQLDAPLVAAKLDEVESIAREMAIRERHTVVHSHGDIVIEAGAIRFGLEQSSGPGVRVLADVEGREIVLLAFDCHQDRPHYHYGPRNRNEVTYLDKTLVPDPLQ